jgi:hypothetical protein
MSKTLPMTENFRDKTFRGPNVQNVWGTDVQSDMLRAWVDDGYDGAYQDPVEGRHTVAHQAPGVQTQQDFCTNRHHIHRI